MLKPLSEILAWKFFLATPWMRLPKWLSKWAKLCLSSKTSSSKSTLSSPFKNPTEIEVKWSHNLWSQKAINLQYLFSSRNCTKTKIFSFKKTKHFTPSPLRYLSYTCSFRFCRTRKNIFLKQAFFIHGIFNSIRTQRFAGSLFWCLNFKFEIFILKLISLSFPFTHHFSSNSS